MNAWHLRRRTSRGTSHGRAAPAQSEQDDHYEQRGGREGSARRTRSEPVISNRRRVVADHVLTDDSDKSAASDLEQVSATEQGRFRRLRTASTGAFCPDHRRVHGTTTRAARAVSRVGG